MNKAILDQFEQYGLYEVKSSIHTTTKMGIRRVSNFVIRLKSENEDQSKTFYLTNEKGQYVEATLTPEELYTTENFRYAVERHGCFLWNGNTEDFIRLKMMIYYTKECDIRMVNIGDMKQGDFMKLKKIIEYAYNALAKKDIDERYKNDPMLDFLIQYGVSLDDFSRLLRNVDAILMNNRNVFIHD